MADAERNRLAQLTPWNEDWLGEISDIRRWLCFASAARAGMRKRPNGGV